MIEQREKEIIRDLAKRVNELSQLPVMKERKKEWYRHNSLEAGKPMLLVFPEGAWRELITPESLQCTDDVAREIEWKLRAKIFRNEEINDDSVVENDWYVNKIISDTGWGIKSVSEANSPIGNVFSVDPALGYVPKVWEKNYKFDSEAHGFVPALNDFADINKIRNPEILYDEKGTMARFNLEQDLLGDILNVQLSGKKYVQFALMEVYSDFRGLEQMLYDLYDEPEMVHEVLGMLEAGYVSMVKQYEDMNLLDLNNNEAYCGSGGVGYTNELPGADFNPDKVLARNIWAFAESQEFSSVSPAMHKEFAIDYEKRLLEMFGLGAYGCCDPLEDKLEYVLDIKGIRRISISPWANVEKCGIRLQRKAVFSWKPNPSEVINKQGDEYLSKYIDDTLSKTKNNNLEIVLKDTHSCNNRPELFREWTDLAREKIDRLYT